MNVECNKCDTTMHFNGLSETRTGFRHSRRVQFKCPACDQSALKVKEHVEGREIYEDVFYGVA